MPTLKYRDPDTGNFLPLEFIAQGPQGEQGEQGPPGDAGNLNALSDVTVGAGTPAGKILGTTGTDQWEPVDPPVGDVTEAPVDGNQYVRQDAGWAAFDTSQVLLLSGGTMTGPLTLDGTAPVADADAADKAYVDSRIWKGTQAQYDAIAPGEAGVLHVILPG